MNYESGTVKNVHYGDVLIKFGDYIDASETELPYISDDAKADKFKNSFLQDGDIIIADTAEDEAVGKCTEIQGSEGLKLLSGLHTIACRPKEKYGPMFLGYYINSPAYHNQLKPLMQGIKVTSISKSALQDTDMIMPQDIEEQEKIGAYFSTLDHLITLHQRKYFIIYNKLITWEQRKLGELAEIVGGGTPSTSVNSYWDGDIDWYAPAEIGEQIYLESSQRKITEEGLNKSSAKILPIGTVLFTSRAGIGKTAILQKEGCTNQGFQSIVPNKEKLDSYFIFTRSEELKRYGETVGAGSTFVEVSGKQMANMELMMPKTTPEQQQIGEFFANLDNLITLHRRAL